MIAAVVFCALAVVSGVMSHVSGTVYDFVALKTPLFLAIASILGLSATVVWQGEVMIAVIGAIDASVPERMPAGDVLTVPKDTYGSTAGPHLGVSYVVVS